MQSLSKAMAGDACTVKWMFGVPELLRYLRANHIEEGSAIQVVQNCWGNMIVEAEGKHFAVSKDVADRIKV